MTAEKGKGPCIVGRLIVEYDEVDSTNNVARRYGEAGEAEGLVISAGSQTQGRGRGGARWFTPKEGALCISILLRPRRREGAMTLLPLLAAQSAAEATESVAAVRATLKWPNDLMVADKKAGGVLCEAFGHGSSAFVVAGVGINVNLTSFDFPREIRKKATSLSDCCGCHVDVRGLLDRLLLNLDAAYGRMRAGKAGGLLKRVRERMPMLGHKVEILTDGRLLKGTAVDILDGGELLLETTDGKKLTIASGHVARCA